MKQGHSPERSVEKACCSLHIFKYLGPAQTCADVPLLLMLLLLLPEGVAPAVFILLGPLPGGLAVDVLRRLIRPCLEERCDDRFTALVGRHDQWPNSRGRAPSPLP